MRMIFTNKVTLNNKWNNYAIGGIGSRSRAIRRQILTRTGENLQGCCHESITLSPVFANLRGDILGYGRSNDSLIGNKMCAVKTNNSELPEYIFIGKDNMAWRMAGGSVDADNIFHPVISKENDQDLMAGNFRIASPSQVIELFNSPNSQQKTGGVGTAPQQQEYTIVGIENSPCPTNGIFA